MARVLSGLFVYLVLTCSSLVFSYPLLTEQEMASQDYSVYEPDPFRLFQIKEPGRLQSRDYQPLAKRRRDENAALLPAPVYPARQIVPKGISVEGDYHLAAKRENFLSMCHFKICNLGRKRRLSQLVKPSSRKG